MLELYQKHINGLSKAAWEAKVWLGKFKDLKQLISTQLCSSMFGLITTTNTVLSERRRIQKAFVEGDQL